MVSAAKVLAILVRTKRYETLKNPVLGFLVYLIFFSEFLHYYRLFDCAGEHMICLLQPRYIFAVIA